MIAADIDLDAAEITAAAVRDAGGEAKAVACDVAQEAQVAALADAADAAFGGTDLIVNNAGVHDDAVFPGMRAAQWHKVIDVSLHGFFHVTQPLLLPM